MRSLNHEIHVKSMGLEPERLSMIPDWPRAIEESVSHLAPGGQTHIVDFGDQAGLQRWLKGSLRHHAEYSCMHRHLYKNYAQYA